MKPNKQPVMISIGGMPLKMERKAVAGEYVTMLSEPFYRIANYDAMEPFFLSIVSSSDHWLFISTTGGLSAGRGSADQALFPYYNVDRLTEDSENTGHKAIFLVARGDRTSLWEPFSERQRGSYAIRRNLYKNVSGSALVFEETNLDLELTFRYAWRTSEKFGFVKTGWLANLSAQPCQVELLDGLQNILPANVAAQSQNAFSSLLDAYKRSELNPESGLAIYALNSQLTDLAEPSESLLATTAVQIGLASAETLLSSAQLERFRAGEGIETECDVRGRRGAYFAHAELALAGKEERVWHILADVLQDSSAVTRKIAWLQGDPAALIREVEEDIAANQASLLRIVSAADGLQWSNDRAAAVHHYANVLFNNMRGGIFVDQYWVRAADFVDFAAARNRSVLKEQTGFFAALPERLRSNDLIERAEQSGAADLIRLCYAYLPLTFSRRHGDPSRPWNRFTINLKKADGSLKLDYEGNWRDIFQNWEALAYSYPEFIESMISTFLNATTADGYNPYRITYHGLDWEVPEPGNPWANIGYWSDHQIIYLQKLMEISRKLHPGKLSDFLGRRLFSYAQVPYRIKPYGELLKDPYSTIEFDWERERAIQARQKELGTDAKLICSSQGGVLHVSLAEKLLTLLLAKLANFVPEGGIWMNTQRPEWNDANNALVGKGLSVVTLCYLRRYIAFCRELFGECKEGAVPLHAEVRALCERMAGILKQYQPALRGAFSDEQRRGVMDALGEAGSDFRWAVYQDGLSGKTAGWACAEIEAFLGLAQEFIEHSLRANRRSDALYHSYNVLHLGERSAAFTHLVEMLEGQVAALSSGLLSGEETLALLDSLRASRLYQAERNTYILYPDRNPPGFLQKNCLTDEQVKGVALFKALEEAGDASLASRDLRGLTHFNGHIRNIKDVNRILDGLAKDPRFQKAVETGGEQIRDLFEQTFHHDEFTGRSGTFFAYEGLGSVYWHMSAKLLLAVQETARRFRGSGQAGRLREFYAHVREGLGFHRTPLDYGAFPSDPYSHSPKGQGAKQPGMTGMVKEVILSREAELGLIVEGGRLGIDPYLLDPNELLRAPEEFRYLDVDGQEQTLALGAGSLAFTVCQTPVILRAASESAIQVHFRDGSQKRLDGCLLDVENSRAIFLRDGSVHHLTVSFPAAQS